MTGSSVSNKSCSAKFTWNVPTGAVAYEYEAVLVGVEGQSPQNPIQPPHGPANEWTFYGLWCSTQYDFRVKARGNGSNIWQGEKQPVIYTKNFSAWATKRATTGTYTPPTPTPTPCTINRNGLVEVVGASAVQQNVQELDYRNRIISRTYLVSVDMTKDTCKTPPTKYYSFTLKNKSHLIIDLTAPHSIALYGKQNINGTPIISVSKYTKEANSTSSVGRTLEAGEYTIGVTLHKDASNIKEFKLRLWVAFPIPYDGYQSDKTVEYKVVIPTPTTVPAQSNVVPTPVPTPVLIKALPTAVARAKQVWNKAVATPWPHVLFCPKGSCESRNADGKTVTVTISSGDDCGGGIACWKNNLVVIKNPAFGAERHNVVCADKLKVDRFHIIWTNDIDKHSNTLEKWLPGIPETDKHCYMYLPGVIMHEFGNVAGLRDVNDTELKLEPGYKDLYILMNSTNVAITAIPGFDVFYLQQVYRHEFAAK